MTALDRAARGAYAPGMAKHMEPDVDQRGGRSDMDRDDMTRMPPRHHKTHDMPMKTPPRQHGSHDMPTKPGQRRAGY